MNANELADIQAFKTEELTIWERNTTATMLRQQQAEIEALKKELTLTDAQINALDNEVKQSELSLDWHEYMRRFARLVLKKAYYGEI